MRRTGDETPTCPGRRAATSGGTTPSDCRGRHPRGRGVRRRDPLFIIYTSGTTGKPKGLVHTSGGYLTQASWTHWAHLRRQGRRRALVHRRPRLGHGAHLRDLRSALERAHPGDLRGHRRTPRTTARHLEIIERYGVTTYYTAPTLIRTFMTWFPEGPARRVRPVELRLLGHRRRGDQPRGVDLVPRAASGGGEAPVVDTWWQSETGAAIIAPLPGVTTIKPGSATVAHCRASRRSSSTRTGERCRPGAGGYLVVGRTWPSHGAHRVGQPAALPRLVLGEVRWQQGYFFSGDGAKCDEDGDIWLLGRVDDVINVSGHRLSTIEIESALVAHPHVGEAGVVGVHDPITGERDRRVRHPVLASARARGRRRGVLVGALCGTPRGTARPCGERDRSDREAPRRLRRCPDLPKTRSGKIMRRLLGDIVDRGPSATRRRCRTKRPRTGSPRSSLLHGPLKPGNSAPIDAVASIVNGDAALSTIPVSLWRIMSIVTRTAQTDAPHPRASSPTAGAPALS